MVSTILQSEGQQQTSHEKFTTIELGSDNDDCRDILEGQITMGQTCGTSVQRGVPSKECRISVNEPAPSSTSSTPAHLSREHHHYAEFEPVLKARNSFKRLVRASQSAIPISSVPKEEKHRSVTRKGHACDEAELSRFLKDKTVFHEGYLTIRDCTTLNLSPNVEHYTQKSGCGFQHANIRAWFQLARISSDDSFALRARKSPTGEFIDSLGEIKIESVLHSKSFSRSFFIHRRNFPTLWLSADSSDDLKTWMTNIKIAVKIGKRTTTQNNDAKTFSQSIGTRLGHTQKANALVIEFESQTNADLGNAFTDIDLNQFKTGGGIKNLVKTHHSPWDCITRIVGKCFWSSPASIKSIDKTQSSIRRADYGVRCKVHEDDV